MSEKLWHKRHDWAFSAACADDDRFILSPAVLGEDQTEEVRQVCWSCPVRPECIVEGLKPVSPPDSRREYPANSIWVAGEWLPDLMSPSSRREVRRRSQALLESWSKEFERRDVGRL